MIKTVITQLYIAFCLICFFACEKQKEEFPEKIQYFPLDSSDKVLLSSENASSDLQMVVHHCQRRSVLT